MSKKNQTEHLRRLTGMNDLLPDDMPYWDFVISRTEKVLSMYHYQQIATPILEKTSLFHRSIGEVTDIIGKEMYSFTDQMSGEAISLRPENTASVARAVIEHNMLYDGYKRLWYRGPMFRHERPQKGRYRQFHQLGIEFLGFEGPEADLEVVMLAHDILKNLEISDVTLEINTLGTTTERNVYRHALIDYFSKHLDQLDEDSIRRLHNNPLRILDSKNPELQDIIANAPKLIDFLQKESLDHFEKVRLWLSHCGIESQFNPRLVRGLDYYNHTVFEWTTQMLGAQGTIIGGGRYDPLFEQLTTQSAPACGWAMGIERAIELVKTKQKLAKQTPDVYLVNVGGVNLACFTVAQQLRNRGIRVAMHCGSQGIKTQMKKADASGAPIAVIIGDNEELNQTAVVKLMRASPKNSMTTPNQVELEQREESAPIGNQFVLHQAELAEFIAQQLTRQA